ncbi:polysaccharide deacetylase family protein [Propionimicrobium lymphophilum]|uniref:polysaccharide deacetylase family protein n=1 Tax=Propionimicrobium lymphophilum TaxID=33012 RepID=UPI002889008A|nr:polysaccharide deacetylase family protein [Propionimicrobium lymphophilum]
MRRFHVAIIAGALLLGGCAQNPASTRPEPTQAVATSQSAAEVTPTPSATPTQVRSEADCSIEKCIALTFDDGPGKFTDKLLDGLKKTDAKVTFFLVGNSIAGNEDTVRRMVDEGHEVANHSFNHPDFVKVGPASAAWQLDTTSAEIQRAAGVAPKLARPPYGSFNDYTPRQNMSFVLWSVDTLDWQNRDVDIMTKNALDGAYPGGIILMHDIHEPTVKAVPALIEKLEAMGYRLVTVSKLLGDGLVLGKVYAGVRKPYPAS